MSNSIRLLIKLALLGHVGYMGAAYSWIGITGCTGRRKIMQQQHVFLCRSLVPILQWLDIEYVLCAKQLVGHVNNVYEFTFDDVIDFQILSLFRWSISDMMTATLMLILSYYE